MRSMTMMEVGDHATVTATNTGGMVHYTIQAGTKAAIEEAIERIERNYNPWGYGTSFYPPKLTKDGGWECFGHRSTSCD